MSNGVLEVEDRRQVLMALSRGVSSCLDVDEVLRTVVRAATELTGSSVAFLWAADDLASTLTLAASSDERIFADVPVTTLRFGQGFVGEVARTRRPIAVPDVFVDPRTAFLDWCRGHDLRGLYATPILFQDSVLGVLCCLGHAPLPEGEAREVLAFFVDQAAVAIRNARLFAESRRREREMTASYALARRLSTRLSVEQILDDVVDGVIEALGCDGAASYRWDEARGGLVYVRGRNHDETIIRRLVLQPGQGVAGRAYAERRPVWSADRAADPSLNYTDDIKRLFGQSARFRGYLAVPILFRDEVVGVLAAHVRTVHAFTPHEVEVLANLANIAATAIQNARHFAEVQQRTQRLEILHRLSLGMTAMLGRDEVFTTVARSVVELFGDVGCSLWVLDRQGDELVLMADEGVRFPALRGTRTMRLGQGLVGSVVARREAIMVADVQEAGHNRALSQAEGFHAAMAVPLLVGERCFGGLSVRRRSKEPFRDEDVELLTALASHAAITIEQARLYEDLTTTNTRLQVKNAELDSFAYAVSHDLKAPLVTLQGMAGVLEEDFGRELGDQGRHYLSRIGATVDQMEHLINDVLMLSRVGREGRPVQTVSLDAMVEDVLLKLGERLRVRGVQVRCDALGAVTAIPVQMDQIFSNLIGNAVKYLGDTAAPAIEIGKAGSEYFVRDNGIGIDPVYHARIFETFQRLHEVEAEGTGVGLAIVKKIVEAAGGRLRVESARGQGATFFFTWPP